MVREMATSRRCSTCNKDPGTMHCTGCDEYFCWRDFKTHREGMFGEMDKIVEERNRIQDAMNNGPQSHAQQSPLLQQIDKWQNSTIDKVKQVAAQARQQAIELLNSKRMKMTTEFTSFSKELAHLKESENYVEHDLSRLNQMINQFKQDLRQSAQPTTVKLHTEHSEKINWDSLIYVEEVSTFNTNNQQQVARKLIHCFFLNEYLYLAFVVGRNVSPIDGT